MQTLRIKRSAIKFYTREGYEPIGFDQVLLRTGTLGWTQCKLYGDRAERVISEGAWKDQHVAGVHLIFENKDGFRMGADFYLEELRNPITCSQCRRTYDGWQEEEGITSAPAEYHATWKTDGCNVPHRGYVCSDHLSILESDCEVLSASPVFAYGN